MFNIEGYLQNQGIWWRGGGLHGCQCVPRNFLAELHRLRPVPGYHECDHGIGLGKDGEIEIRLSAGDIYKVISLLILGTCVFPLADIPRR